MPKLTQLERIALGKLAFELKTIRELAKEWRVCERTVYHLRDLYTELHAESEMLKRTEVTGITEKRRK